MYAHKVIEDLNFLTVKHFKKQNLFLCRELIKGAQKFYLGEVDPLSKIFNNTFGPIAPEIGDSVRIPFKTCCFSSFNNNNAQFSKSYFLVIENEDGSEVTIFSFHFYVSLKKWVPFPLAVVFSDDTKGAGGLIGVRNDFFYIDSPELTEEYMQEGLQFFAPVMFGLKLLSCKNITTEDIPPPEKLNKKRIKNGKQPLFTYKTLVIKPTGKKQESQAAQGLWDNRVHLCRGHFKTYTEQNPLFGRITGRFWWQAAVRGNKDCGVVVKDYIVGTST